jgi:hypothetical protein
VYVHTIQNTLRDFKCDYLALCYPIPQQIMATTSSHYLIAS